MLQAKNIEEIEKNKKEASNRMSSIAKQWVSFSKTEAFADFMEYGHTTSDMLTSYAKERVMPSPLKDGGEIIIDGETANSLLQNSRGCDIILSYVEQFIEQPTK